jgi:hypothetical protein
MTLSAAVLATLQELPLTPADKGAAALALRLADQLRDETGSIRVGELSARLLATLESLGATPAARRRMATAANAPVGAPEKPTHVVDDLRAKRDRAAQRAGS